MDLPAASLPLSSTSKQSKASGGCISNLLIRLFLFHSVTFFDDNLDRILLNSTARVPQLVGNMQNDGTLFTVGQSNLSAFLIDNGFGGIVSPDTVRALYPGQNDTNVIADSYRDIVFLWYVDIAFLHTCCLPH